MRRSRSSTWGTDVAERARAGSGAGWRAERARRRAESSATLRIRDLHVHYDQSHALQGVDLTLDEGVHAVVGRNGMGKTTLCNAVMGLLPVRRGSIRFEGEDVTGLPPYQVAARGIAYTPQGRRLWPALTVDEHLRLAGRGGGSWTPERVYGVFPRLAERRRNGGGQLSGGEQQMLAIARALLQDPRLLVLDEPTEGLAPLIVAQLEELLSTLAQEGDAAILLIEQNIGVATAIAEDVAIMVNGRISRVIPAEELARDRALQQRLLGVGRESSGGPEPAAPARRDAADRAAEAVPLGPPRSEAGSGDPGREAEHPGRGAPAAGGPAEAGRAGAGPAPSRPRLAYVPPTRWSRASWGAPPGGVPAPTPTSTLEPTSDAAAPAAAHSPSPEEPEPRSPPGPFPPARPAAPRPAPPEPLYREPASPRPDPAGDGGEVLVAGTFDTKGAELRYVRDRLAAHGLHPRTVDLSTSGRPSSADVPPHHVAAHHPRGANAVFTGDRGASVGAMAEAFERWIGRRNGVGGIISAGGSGGTALAAPAMRRLPVGTPKVMISTVASGDVGRYVGASDIMMMYSVTDVQGLNRISRRVLANGANALAGMVRAAERAPSRPPRPPRPPRPDDDRPGLGLTMFGVTTPAVQQIAARVEDRYDCLVFHATGVGGRSMEKLADSGLLAAAVDLTTTEVCDMMMGGVLAADEDRFGAFIRTRIPWVGSVGALDMVNFGPRDTVPERYRGRRFVEHNPEVTLMRTTAEENARMGEWIARRINEMSGPVRFLIPEGGVSALDAPGQPFHDPEADRALFDTIARTFEEGADRRLVRTPHHVNDAAFADAVAGALAAVQPPHHLAGRPPRHASL